VLSVMWKYWNSVRDVNTWALGGMVNDCTWAEQGEGEREERWGLLQLNARVKSHALLLKAQTILSHLVDQLCTSFIAWISCWFINHGQGSCFVRVSQDASCHNWACFCLWAVPIRFFSTWYCPGEKLAALIWLLPSVPLKRFTPPGIHEVFFQNVRSEEHEPNGAGE